MIIISVLDLIGTKVISYLWTAGRRADDMVPAQEGIMSPALQRSDRRILQILYKVLRRCNLWLFRYETITMLIVIRFCFYPCLWWHVAMLSVKDSKNP